MYHRREDLMVSSPVRAKFIGHKLPGSLTLMLQCLTKEGFGSMAVSMLRYQNIDNISILIHCSPQVVARASDGNECLIDVPDISEPSLFSAQRSCIDRPKFDAPISNCLIRDGDTTFGKQIFNIAKAECESMIEPNGMANDFRGKPVTFINGFHPSIVVEIDLT